MTTKRFPGWHGCRTWREDPEYLEFLRARRANTRAREQADLAVECRDREIRCRVAELAADTEAWKLGLPIFLAVDAVLAVFEGDLSPGYVDAMLKEHGPNP